MSAFYGTISLWCIFFLNRGCKSTRFSLFPLGCWAVDCWFLCCRYGGISSSSDWSRSSPSLSLYVSMLTLTSLALLGPRAFRSLFGVSRLSLWYFLLLMNGQERSQSRCRLRWGSNVLKEANKQRKICVGRCTSFVLCSQAVHQLHNLILHLVSYMSAATTFCILSGFL